MEEGPIEAPLADITWNNRIVNIQKDRFIPLNAIACEAV